MISGPLLHVLRLGITLLGLTFSGLMITAAPARADLRVCNETGNLVSVALGYRAERGWQSEGWWQTPPGNCRVLYQGDLARSYYYVYAADDIGGGDWGGSFFMCTRDETFTIFGVEDCLARGYERTGFFEINTQGKTEWTLQLTEGEAAPRVIAPDGEENLEEPLLLVDPDDVDIEIEGEIEGEFDATDIEGTDTQ
ncbi:DUF1036 domain-containing protein [Devosia nitrariae]|uniref:DUF1036 domain-containing protein n=1 Tax=Devosia nitrariae TaxID=2071872 RepID=A0ABQ5WAS2_9HYPH|nr:hypothetical protein GCM10010862_41500 [Devosia nitrariae]